VSYLLYFIYRTPTPLVTTSGEKCRNYSHLRDILGKLKKLKWVT